MKGKPPYGSFFNNSVSGGILYLAVRSINGKKANSTFQNSISIVHIHSFYSLEVWDNRSETVYKVDYKKVTRNINLHSEVSWLIFSNRILIV